MRTNLKGNIRNAVFAGVGALALCVLSSSVMAEDEHEHEHKPAEKAEAKPAAKPEAKAEVKPAAVGAVHEGHAAAPVGHASGVIEVHEYEHEHEHHEHHEFHERHVHLFDPLEFAIWAGGTWVEGWYNGQYGWWWVSGGRRYYYPRPIYPYPPEVSEVWVPETVVIQQAPVAAPPPPPPVSGYAPPPPQAGLWYYCDNPPGYYPYVQVCPTPFRPVPAQPR